MHVAIAILLPAVNLHKNTTGCMLAHSAWLLRKYVTFVQKIRTDEKKNKALQIAWKISMQLLSLQKHSDDFVTYTQSVNWGGGEVR